MIHTFPINFVQKAIEQTLLKKHIENPNYFGGENQIQLFSFYEQLKNQDELDRYVERYRDLVDQQNRTGLIGNGILATPENPTITNLYSSLIIPMTFTCMMRVMLENRDQMIETLFELINELKGTKVDIAELKCLDENGHVYYEPFMVGTLGHGDDEMSFDCGNFIGAFSSGTPSISDFRNRYLQYLNLGLTSNIQVGDYVYFEHGNKLKTAIAIASEVWGDITLLDTNYDDDGMGYILVNGSISFKSDDQFETLPTFTSVEIVFGLQDNTHSQTFNVVVPIDNNNVSLDEDGYVVFTAMYSFKTPESDWDRESLYLYIDGGEYPQTTTVYSFQTIEDDGTYDNVIFPPEHISFEKYKLSLSFDSLRCDTPRTLNGKEYCELSFGGSATLVNNGVKLGNDLVKISMQKNKILAQTPIEFSNATIYYLEPLEMPSGSGANTIPNQLASNAFKVNSHTDSLTLTLQYTFIADDTKPILKQLFDYGRYGTTGITENDISPNIIYNMVEWWSSWGDVQKKTYLGKLIENIDIENTESDTLTLTTTFQIQGENN